MDIRFLDLINNLGYWNDEAISLVKNNEKAFNDLEKNVFSEKNGDFTYLFNFIPMKMKSSLVKVTRMKPLCKSPKQKKVRSLRSSFENIKNLRSFSKQEPMLRIYDVRRTKVFRCPNIMDSQSGTAVVVPTEIATFIFSSDCIDFKECVAAVLESRIDCEDEDFAVQGFDLLFGPQTDTKIFSFLGNLFWDGLMNPDIVLPLRLSTCLDGVDLRKESLITSRFRFLAHEDDIDLSVMESQSGPSELIQLIGNITSYQEIMTTLKPIGTLRSLFNIWNAEDVSEKFAEIIALMELHNLYWTLTSEKLTACVDCLVTLFKNVGDLPELFQTYISGGDANLQPPSSGVMESQTFQVDESGMLAKALNFGKEFGIAEDVIKSCGPFVAMFTTSIAAVALIGCGDKIQTDALEGTFSKFIHSIALSCRDWKIILGSLKSTWEFIASGLGQFLGFTYMDDKTAIRSQLIDKVEALKKEVQELDETKFFKFKSLSDPLYFQEFNKKFENLEKLISDIMRSDQNLMSLKLQIDELKTKFETIKEEFTTLFHSTCGKQQPTTIWIGSSKSGIGKTTFMEYLQEQLSDLEGRQLTKYVRNSMEAYWSTYVYQDIVHLRDFGQSTEELEHIELINIYDPASYQLAMSDNNQKGRQFKSRFVFIDSNQLYIRRSKTTQDPRKLDRRRDFLFEAYSDFPKTESRHTPLKEDVLKHLILHRINPIGIDFDEEPDSVQRSGPRRFKEDSQKVVKQVYTSAEFDVIYTLDGRDIIFEGKERMTQKFSTIVQFMCDHEAQQNSKFMEESKLKYEKKIATMKQKMVDETHEPAVSYNVCDSKKIIIFRGPSGCGKTFTAKKFRGNDPDQEEFTHTPNIRARVLKQFNECTEDLILTTNPDDYDEWISQWQDEEGGDLAEKIAFERRCIFVDFSFKQKKRGMFANIVWSPEYYDHTNIESDPSGYTRYVNFHINGRKYTYAEILKKVQENLAIKTDGAYVYSFAPRFSCNINTVRNFVEIDMKWSDMDEIKGMAKFSLLNKIKINRSEFSMPVLLKTFSQIVNDVFQHYELNTELEDGLVQLNSLRIESPLDFDCLVKLKDAAFILTTDHENKIVFCIADDAFRYAVENGVVVCYSGEEKMWEETGKVAVWYEHLLRNVEKIQINYKNFTPPSSNFVTYCDHFLNFLKTIGAGYALYKLCKLPEKKLPIESESMYNLYDYSIQKKSESLGSGNDPDEFSKSHPKISHSSTHFKVSNHKIKAQMCQESLQSSPDPDEYSKSHPRVSHSQNFKIFKNYKVKLSKAYDSEAQIDSTASIIAEIVMDQNYPLKLNGQHVAFAQGIFEDIIVTIGHIIEGVQIEIENVLYDLELLSLCEHTEKAIFRVVGLPNKFRDIRKYFQKTSSTHSHDGMLAALYTWDSKRKTKVEKAIVLCEQRKQITTTGTKYGMIYQVSTLGHIAPIQTAKGWCGSPLIINNPSVPHKFLGLHTAADLHRGLSSIIYQSDFNHLIDFTSESSSMTDEAIDVLPFQQVILTNDPLPENFSDKLKVIGKPGKIKDGSFIPNNVHYCDQTQFHRSPFSTGDEVTCEPAILGPRDPRCVGEMPDILITGVNKFGREQPEIDLDVLDECYQELTDKMVDIVRETQLRTKILTETEVINGCSLYETSPSMNMQSGTGYPHNFEFPYVMQKKNMFDFDVIRGIYEISKNEAGQQLKNDCKTYLSYLRESKNGQSAVIYVAQKKDEPRPMEKINSMSTRAFFMGPTYHFMIWKQYYGAAQALLTLTNGVSPFKIGIDASSIEFAKLYKYLSAVSEIGMNGDYSGFDTCHPEVFLERNSQFYNAIYRATDPDWKPEHDHIRNRLAKQEQKPLVLVNGLIVQCPGGNMSGGPDTGGRNNITGCVNMRYCWKILARKYDSSKYYDYDKYTIDAVYGDDIIKTVSPDVMSWYNPQNIREIITSLGFKITAADKQEDLIFKPLSELTFLKRNFSNVQIKIRGVDRVYMVGALQDEVFFKMLNWCKSTKRRFFKRNAPIHFDRQTIGDTALACLFQACLRGEDYFNDVKEHLISCAAEFQIKLPPLPYFRQAFFQTYFKEIIPRDINEIEIPLDHPYSPLFVKPFVYNKLEFKTIYQCYEYNKILLHATKDNNLVLTANKILLDHQLASKLGNSITVNEKFNSRRLILNIIKARFSNETFKINEIDQFKNLQHHQILGGANNEYGKLLTEFAKSHLMAPESKKINKVNKLTTFEKRINRYKLNLINKEGILNEFKVLNFTNKINKK